VKGDEPRLQLLVNALVTLGRGDGWGSTNANAAALRALAERLSPPLRGTAPHTVRVRLGSELRTLALGPEAPLGHLVASAAEDGEVALEPGKNAGVLGMRAETTYVPAADGSQVAAQASGFVVAREWLRVKKGADVPPERVPLAQPGTTLALAVGDLVEEHVQVVNPEERHYVAVVVPLAAGMEAAQPEARHRLVRRDGGGRADPRADLHGLPRRPALLLLRHLPQGTFDFYFRARAATGGRFVQPAAQAEMMYDGSVRGNSAGARVEVAPPAERR